MGNRPVNPVVHGCQVGGRVVCQSKSVVQVVRPTGCRWLSLAAWHSGGLQLVAVEWARWRHVPEQLITIGCCAGSSCAAAVQCITVDEQAVVYIWVHNVGVDELEHCVCRV
jgi:hypothetical protein